MVKEGTELTTMVSYGTGTQQKICFSTTYHPSFMVRWSVLLHSGQQLTPIAVSAPSI
jgi:hypothetical protein